MRVCEAPQCDVLTSNERFCSIGCTNATKPKRQRSCKTSDVPCSYKDCECHDRLGDYVPKSKSGDRSRLDITKLCENCSKPFTTKNLNKRFCNGTCAARFVYDQRRGISRAEEIALWLEGKLSPNGRNGRDRAGLAGWAREYLLDQARYACTQCGWNTPHPRTGKPPLEVDHIDGDRNNNFFNNVRILCPNCHALTDTYRRGNLGRYSKD